METTPHRPYDLWTYTLLTSVQNQTAVKVEAQGFFFLHWFPVEWFEIYSDASSLYCVKRYEGTITNRK
jgi:hypothetical protein